MNWPVRAANGLKLEVILLPKLWNLLISMVAVVLVVIVGMRGEEGGDVGWVCVGGACVRGSREVSRLTFQSLGP
jgi:hypothetical protein